MRVRGLLINSFIDKIKDLFVDKSRPIDKTCLWMRAKGSLIHYFMDKSKDPLLGPVYGRKSKFH